jgi:hypothetical protein
MAVEADSILAADTLTRRRVIPDPARQKGAGLPLGVRPCSGRSGPFGYAVADESEDGQRRIRRKPILGGLITEYERAA